MIHTMANQMVVTNLRLPYADWLQVKTVAAEQGLSVNEYINEAVAFVTKAKSLVANLFAYKKSTVNDPILDWPNLTKKIKIRPMGLSADDILIYGE